MEEEEKRRMASFLQNEAEAKAKWSKHIEIESKYMFPMHIELGRMYGYPECCIQQFAKEALLGMPVALVRSLKHKKLIPNFLGYVPCDKCMQNF